MTLVGIVGLECDNAALLTSFQEGLEDDCGRDRVQRMSFQEGPHKKLEFFQVRLQTVL